MIERATSENLAAILSLQKLAYTSEAELYGEYQIPPLTQTLAEIRAEFEHSTFLKATIDGKIVGSVRAYLDAETCHIGRLIVHPDFQGRGLGTRLMRAIEQQFSAADRFELFTGHRSERNLYLYQKLGYTIFKAEPVTAVLALAYLEKPGATIRPATPDDAAAIAAILQNVGWFDANLSADWVQRSLARCAANNSHTVYVAENAGGDVLGYAAVHWLPYQFLSGPEGYISELFIHDAARGQGIGSKLLAAIKTEAGQRGCARLSLITSRHRESYQRNFYGNHGWQEREMVANFVYPLESGQD